jgi:hypothetical protein
MPPIGYLLLTRVVTQLWDEYFAYLYDLWLILRGDWYWQTDRLEELLLEQLIEEL